MKLPNIRPCLPQLIPCDRIQRDEDQPLVHARQAGSIAQKVIRHVESVLVEQQECRRLRELLIQHMNQIVEFPRVLDDFLSDGVSVSFHVSHSSDSILRLPQHENTKYKPERVEQNHWDLEQDLLSVRRAAAALLRQHSVRGLRRRVVALVALVDTVRRGDMATTQLGAHWRR